MATKIRLARGGSKKRPFYRIVIADERAPRDGNFIEKIGNFNPMVPKDHKERVVISKERAEHWLKVGAQPTDRVQRILSDLGMMEAPKITEKTKKHLPKAKAQERIKAKEEAALKAEEDAKAAQSRRLSYLSETLADALQDMERAQEKLKDYNLENSALAQENFISVSYTLGFAFSFSSLDIFSFESNLSTSAELLILIIFYAWAFL